MKNLETDSGDYHVLANATKLIHGVSGILCEIGTRRGGSLKIIIDSLLENNDFNRNVIGIDPYGNVPYISSEGALVLYDYTNDMRNETFASLYTYIQNKPVNLLLFVLEDSEFFKRYSDGVPFYFNVKTVIDRYSLVFFDGPHDLQSIFSEMAFFLPRTSIGGIWIIDDIHVVNYDKIKEFLLGNGFVLIEETTIKASFKKFTNV